MDFLKLEIICKILFKKIKQNFEKRALKKKEKILKGISNSSCETHEVSDVSLDTQGDLISLRDLYVKQVVDHYVNKIDLNISCKMSL